MLLNQSARSYRFLAAKRHHLTHIYGSFIKKKKKPISVQTVAFSKETVKLSRGQTLRS